MSRVVKRLASLVLVSSLLAALLAACSSSSHNNTEPKSTTSTTEPAENAAWIAAAAKGVLSSSQAKSITPAQANCFAKALIDSVTVARMKAAGVTQADLSDPKRDLPAGFSASLPANVKTDFGAALQSCGFAHVIGPALAASIASDQSSTFKLDARAQACVVDGFGAPAHRVLVADLLLSPSPSDSDASDFAGLLLGCIDFAQLVQSNVSFKLSAQESTCINGKARTDQTLRQEMAASIVGKGGTSNSNAEQLLGASLISCLTPEHILQLGGKSP